MPELCPLRPVRLDSLVTRASVSTSTWVVWQARVNQQRRQLRHGPIFLLFRLCGGSSFSLFPGYIAMRPFQSPLFSSPFIDIVFCDQHEVYSSLLSFFLVRRSSSASVALFVTSSCPCFVFCLACINVSLFFLLQVFFVCSNVYHKPQPVPHDHCF